LEIQLPEIAAFCGAVAVLTIGLVGTGNHRGDFCPERGSGAVGRSGGVVTLTSSDCRVHDLKVTCTGAGNVGCGHPTDYSGSFQFVEPPEIVFSFHPDAAKPFLYDITE
jgi:hypothetical protein